MDNPDILDRFTRLRIWRRGERRAPHKPLLLIWAIGQCIKGEERLNSYALVDANLADLLQRFAPNAGRQGTHYPFWRLQNDNLWEIDKPDLVRPPKGGNVSRRGLFEHDIRGGLRVEDFAAIQDNPSTGFRITISLLDAHFPVSLHNDILRAAGFIDAWQSLEGQQPDVTEYVWSRRRKRDGAFRARVLDAYEERCAVCAFAVRVTDDPIAIDAAHIRWHSHNGPDETRNGLALCTLHHKLFDYGAFTVLPDMKIFVSESAQGNGRYEALERHHQKTLKKVPDKTPYEPAEEFLAWHGRQIFRTPLELVS